MIPTASYAIYTNQRDPPVHHAVIYDQNANELQRVPLEQSEYNYSSVKRIDAMLDPAYTDLARPARVVIGHHIKLGRTIFYYDKHNNLMKYQAYRNPATDLHSIKDYAMGRYGYRFDFDWMIANNVPVEARPDPKLCTLL